MNFIKNKLANLAVFVLCFSGGVVLFGAYFIVRHFGTVDFGQILFHLRFPLLDGDTPFVAAFVKTVLAPSLVLSLCLAFPLEIYRFVRFRFLPFSLKIYAFLSKRATISKLAFGIALFALCLNATNNKLKITRYLKAQESYSTLYEKHYKAFDDSVLQGFSPKQNLIVILAESLESTFSSQNIPAQSQYAQMGGGGVKVPCIRPLASLSQTLQN